MLTTGETYTDPGGDFFARRNPERTRKRLVGQLERLGLHRHPPGEARGRLSEISLQRHSLHVSRAAPGRRMDVSPARARRYTSRWSTPLEAPGRKLRVAYASSLDESAGLRRRGRGR